MLDTLLHFVFTIGLLTTGACLTLHCYFMFMVLRTQVAFRRRYPSASGAWLLVPSMLLAAAVLVVSSFLQIGIWAAVLWQVASFERIADVIYFSGTTYTTLGTGKHLLVPPYCLLEPMEATNGILAAGLNAAILFAILSNVARRWSDYDEFFR